MKPMAGSYGWARRYSQRL